MTKQIESEVDSLAILLPAWWTGRPDYVDDRYSCIIGYFDFVVLINSIHILSSVS